MGFTSVVLTRYTGNKSRVVFPYAKKFDPGDLVTSKNGREDYSYTVITEIADECFKDITLLKYVSGNCVEYIGENAFLNCSNLSEVYFPYCNYIGPSAFDWCDLLSHVTICRSPEIEFTLGTTYWDRTLVYKLESPFCGTPFENSQMDNRGFAACGGTIYNVDTYAEGIDDDSYTSVNKYAALQTTYYGETYWGPEYVYLPNCTNIGEQAFAYCRRLQDLYIPKVLNIGAGAFKYCDLLQHVNLPEESLEIGSSAFMGCSNIHTLSIPGEYVHVESDAFSDVSPSEAYIPYFSSYYGMTGLNLSALVCSAEYLPLDFNKNNILYLSMSYYNIDSASKTFSNCSNLLDAYVWYVGESHAFENCSNLYSVLIAHSHLANIIIPSYAFKNCVSLQSIGDGINTPTVVDYEAFYNCKELTNEYLLLLVEYIGSSAFCNCGFYNIERTGSRLNYIGENAFKGCESLSCIQFRASSVITLQNSNAFLNTPFADSSYLGMFGSFKVPESLITSYKTAPNWSYYSDRFDVL